VSFDQHAHSYDDDLRRGLSLSGEPKEFFARGRLEAAREFFDRTGLRPSRVLEFGCGIGTNLGIIRELWPQSDIVGLDSSPASLDIARRQHGAAGIRLMTPDRYRQEGASRVDWVFCNGVLHHVPREDHRAVLRAIEELLERRGVLTLFENNPFNPGTRLVMRRIPFDRDARTINPYRLAAMLRSAGFEDVSLQFLFIFPRWLSVLRPIEPRLRRVPLGAQYALFAFRRGA